MNTSWLQQPTFQQFPQNRILIETTSQRRPHLLVEETEIAVHHFAMHLFCVFENGGEKVSFCKVTVAQKVSNLKKNILASTTDSIWICICIIIDIGKCDFDKIAPFCSVYSTPPEKVKSSIPELGIGIFYEIDKQSGHYVYQFQNGRLFEIWWLFFFLQFLDQL